MQFMSQSTGWADNIILAMAPLGIITIIVSAIRAGGPSWLKAVIGRARESFAVTESELLSSTSQEVCELWNGQQIVRVMGTGPIREFIILLPKGGSSKDRGVSLEERQEAYGRVPKPSVVIIRNTEAHAPNLSLNVNNQPGRGELYAVAAFGVILQLAVIVYSGLATYHLMLLKDEALPAAYAFPCTAAGMFCLAIGMLVCSHVVESSTSETRYRPADGMEAHVVWLQKSATVNDQAFEPFAVFPCKPQPIVTVSYRASAREQERRTMAIENFVAASGAAISMCGFLTQFIGLRGMHWSVSIAQLGATIIMTLLRTWVRRNLAEKPKAVPLVSGHELDWLAMTLRGNHTKAPWFGALEDLEPLSTTRRGAVACVSTAAVSLLHRSTRVWRYSATPTV
ncbi:hypothetical protein B0T25DRAFT_593994 [Lasiosphaeria hispida]|uniref:Uncharacterized protein n=1 Tax=Lasiosphaeria hispida TaxID=260671 RepID=A0AAJ0H6X0_9PEZI|nr:hypothetical protein B0T25DRAFT_593994 [Lasiosphaeria hispida]